MRNGKAPPQTEGAFRISVSVKYDGYDHGSAARCFVHVIQYCMANMTLD